MTAKPIPLQPQNHGSTSSDFMAQDEQPVRDFLRRTGRDKCWRKGIREMRPTND
ncbi:hypothetical protein [Parasphingopyxis sp.]|uniref:hypothetical protein n=1 Tax=Parasphingopyxis sp. TaxID=1920299 RepID=UPI00260A6545|nr:hypothetical protein [Parasphingopyxis sp.]